MNRFPYIRWLPIIATAALTLFGAVLYYGRSPVVVVSNNVFSTLYGVAREKTDRALMSILVQRRIAVAEVTADAGAEIAAIAAKDAAKHPFLVIFPARLAESALYYCEKLETAPDYKKAPVVVLAERTTKNAATSSAIADAEKSVFFAETDWETDLYRAGFAAGIMAAEYSSAFSSARDIVLFHDGSFTDEKRAFFEAALKDAGFAALPSYKRSGEKVDMNTTACVVLLGPADDFLAVASSMPLIVFTWVNPVYFPKNVALTFDDSVWGTADAVVRNYEKKRPQKIAAKMTFFSRDTHEKVEKANEKIGRSDFKRTVASFFELP